MTFPASSRSRSIRWAALACLIVVAAAAAQPTVKIAYAQSTGGIWNLYTANLDGSEETRIAIDAVTMRSALPSSMNLEGRWTSGLTCSPDGRQIAFARGPDPVLDIFVIDADGSSERRLTDGTTVNRNPEWSPDGRRIAFASNRTSGTYDIYVMDADGGNVERLTAEEKDEHAPAWSPDGRQLAFTANHTGGMATDFNLFVMDVDDPRSAREIYHEFGFVGYPAWSPDGQKIAFQIGNVTQAQIRVVDADGSNPVDIAWGLYPRWSPDGSQIMYSTISTFALHTYIANADGSDARRVWEEGQPYRGVGIWLPVVPQTAVQAQAWGLVKALHLAR